MRQSSFASPDINRSGSEDRADWIGHPITDIPIERVVLVATRQDAKVCDRRKSVLQHAHHQVAFELYVNGRSMDNPIVHRRKMGVANTFVELDDRRTGF